MSSMPILAIPNADHKFWMEVDALGYAIGGVLSQRQDDSSWRPVSFISQPLSETERNYKIYDHKLLAVMTGLWQWRQYLLGTNQIIKTLGIFTSPKSLITDKLTGCPNSKTTILNWSTSQETQWKKLSRWPDHDNGKGDNDEKIVLRPEKFRVIEVKEDGVWKEVREAKK